jgi:hypothetical protein
MPLFTRFFDLDVVDEVHSDPRIPPDVAHPGLYVGFEASSESSGVVRGSELSAPPLPKSKLSSELEVVLEAWDATFPTGGIGAALRFRSAAETVVGSGAEIPHPNGSPADPPKTSSDLSTRLRGGAYSGN